MKMAEAASPASKYPVKWSFALAIGLPVAVGVGYWYLKNKNKTAKCNDLEKKNKSKSHKISIDGDASTQGSKEHSEKALTPLNLAFSHKEKGNEKFRSQKYEEALSSYEEAIKICPENETLNLAIFYQNKAAAYEQLKKYEDAKEACTKALSYNPKYVKALLRRGNSYKNMNKLSLALEDFITAGILENFESQFTLTAADQVLKQLGQQHAKEAMAKRVPVMPSNFYIKAHFSSFANNPINAFLHKTDGDTSRGFLKAVDCFKKENYEDIIPACTEEINASDQEALYKNEALILRGTFYHLIGEKNLGLPDLDKVINNNEVSAKLRAHALIIRASIHIQLEDFQNCINDFNAAIVIDQHNPDIYHHRAQLNILLDKLNEATEDFKLAVSLNPGNPVTLSQKYFSDYKMALLMKDPNLANYIAKCEQTVNEYPECSECYMLYSQVLIDQQEFEKADKLLEKAIKIEPKHVILLVRRAILILQWKGDMETALKYINEALAIDNKCEYAYEALGTIEVHRGNLEKAIETFNKVIPLVKTEMEMSHIFSLRDAAVAQKTVGERMNVQLPRYICN